VVFDFAVYDSVFINRRKGRVILLRGQIERISNDIFSCTVILKCFSPGVTIKHGTAEEEHNIIIIVVIIFNVRN